MEITKESIIKEKAELDSKAKELSNFIGYNPVFDYINTHEQERLKVQNDLMWQLSEIMGKLINNLTNAIPP